VVILLDLFSTLVHGGDEDREKVGREMAADLGVDADEFNRLWVATWRDRMTGALGDLAATLRTLAGRLGGQPTDAQVDRAVARRLVLTERLLRPDPGTLAALDGLRERGYRLGLVSNCTAEVPAAWAATPLAGRFAATAFSCLVGYGKPDPHIFRAACAALDTDPATCVYLGDGADEELPGAASLGMRAIQTVQYHVGDRRWTGERIGDLAELAGLLALNGRPG
jgi:putative hydrolase of the HAD superfamily